MKYRLLLLLILCSSFLSAIVANHVPPLGYELYQQQELRVEIAQGWSDISEALVFYRIQGDTQYKQVYMEKENPQSVWLRGYLPATSSPDAVIEYYFKFTLATGAIETLPVLEADTRPFTLRAKVKAGDLSEDFVMVSEEGSVMAKDGYILAVSWYALEGLLDTNSIKLFVNGKNVTKKADISSNMLIYKDETPKPGVTTAFVTATTTEGKNVYSKTWTNIIKASGNITELPMNLRGTVNAGTNVYSTSKDENAVAFGSNDDDGWASLDMYADYKKLELQSYTYLSTLEEADRQHVNRFKLGIMLPFWDTYVGDYSPEISDLTMSNKNIRGIYSNLHSKYFGFSFAHGEMVRAIEGRSYVNAYTNQVAYYPGTFKQEAFATRIRLGREDGFSLGFNTTRNRDIISSLNQKYIMRDTTQIAFPKDNLVVSMDAKLSIPAQNIIVGIEGAGSLYNSNTLPGPLSSDDLEDYIDGTAPVNPSDFQDIFIINTNMQPLPLSADFEDPMSLVAWQAYLRNFWLNNLIDIKYSEVGASFKSLSTSYLQSDVSQLSLSDQFNFKQYFYLSGGFNQTRDNLSKDRLENNIYNNMYVSGMVRIPMYPYLSISYTNGNSKNEKNTEIDSVDTSAYDPYNPYKRLSTMISVGLGYEFGMLPIAPSTLDIGFRTGNDNEKRPDANGVFEKRYNTETENISLSLISRFIDLPLKTQIAISNNVQERDAVTTPVPTSASKNSNFNFQLKGEYRLFNNLLVPWAEYRSTLLGGDQDKQAYNYLTLGADARPLESTTVSTSLGWQLYGNNDVDNADYSTIAWHFNASYRF